MLLVHAPQLHDGDALEGSLYGGLAIRRFRPRHVGGATLRQLGMNA